MKQPTTVERVSDTEVRVTRVVNAPVRKVFAAWTRAELFRQWWVPESAPVKLLSCEMDARVGGGYKLVFEHQGGEMAFFGKYTEVVPDVRLVWTNDESGEAGQVTTVTFDDLGDKTRVVMSDRYRSKEALDAGIGSLDGAGETFEQLDELLS
jgi:uncharacterized protein YndB with AHSA1/START domain